MTLDKPGSGGDPNSERRRGYDAEFRDRLTRIESEVLDIRKRMADHEARQLATEAMMADAIAKQVARTIFSLIGIDVDKPESLEEFRANVRFSAVVHKAAQAGVLAVITTVAGLVISGLWFGAMRIFSGHD